VGGAMPRFALPNRGATDYREGMTDGGFDA
jgi:hypothetical protein